MVCMTLLISQHYPECFTSWVTSRNNVLIGISSWPWLWLVFALSSESLSSDFEVQCKPSKLGLYPHHWTWKVGTLKSILGCNLDYLLGNQLSVVTNCGLLLIHKVCAPNSQYKVHMNSNTLYLTCMEPAINAAYARPCANATTVADDDNTLERGSTLMLLKDDTATNTKSPVDRNSAMLRRIRFK